MSLELPGRFGARLPIVFALKHIIDVPKGEGRPEAMTQPQKGEVKREGKARGSRSAPGAPRAVQSSFADCFRIETHNRRPQGGKEGQRR